MYDLTAVRTAIDLLHVPWRVRLLRAQSLPKDLSPLLRVAAGDEKVLRWISDKTDRSKDVIREAAEFYIEQILMAPDADSYRVLGARRGADGRSASKHGLVAARLSSRCGSPRQARDIGYARHHCLGGR